MRFLVTGGAGYVGSRIVEMLLSRRHQVDVLDRLDYGADALLMHFEDPHFVLYPMGLDKFNGTTHYDCVIHLAALVGEPICFRRPDECYRVNLSGTERLLTTVHYDNFLYISTCSNYGVVKGEQATELTPTNPTGEYSISKIAAEKLVLGAGGAVLRLGTVCGLSRRMRFDTLVNEFAYRAAHNQAIEIYGPEAWRPFLLIEDLLQRLTPFLYDWRERTHKGQIYNMVSQNMTKRQLGDMVLKYFPETTVQYVEPKQTAVDPRDYSVSDQKWVDTFQVKNLWPVVRAFNQVWLAAKHMADPHASHFVNRR